MRAGARRHSIALRCRQLSGPEAFPGGAFSVWRETVTETASLPNGSVAEAISRSTSIPNIENGLHAEHMQMREAPPRK